MNTNEEIARGDLQQMVDEYGSVDYYIWGYAEHCFDLLSEVCDDEDQ